MTSHGRLHRTAALVTHHEDHGGAQHSRTIFKASNDLRRADEATIGDDLRPHLHRDRGSAEFNDGLLNDWDIHHLHLSTTVESDGYVTRSKFVLFARVTKDHFDCIAILVHGGGHDPWTNAELLEIVHRNWPQSIEHMRQNFPAGQQPAAGERNVPAGVLKQLRKRHVNVFTQRSDGAVHMPIGGGVSASGADCFVSKERDRIWFWCRWFDNELKQQVEQWSERGGVVRPMPNSASGRKSPTGAFSLSRPVMP